MHLGRDAGSSGNEIYSFTRHIDIGQLHSDRISNLISLGGYFSEKPVVLGVNQVIIVVEMDNIYRTA